MHKSSAVLAFYTPNYRQQPRDLSGSQRKSNFLLRKTTFSFSGLFYNRDSRLVSVHTTTGAITVFAVNISLSNHGRAVPYVSFDTVDLWKVAAQNGQQFC